VEARTGAAAALEPVVHEAGVDVDDPLRRRPREEARGRIRRFESVLEAGSGGLCSTRLSQNQGACDTRQVRIRGLMLEGRVEA
jgi:hypothetical protein